MFLRATKRFKDGKEQRYWSIVENRRCRGNRIVQRQVLYLGEINDVQHDAWCKTVEVLEQGRSRSQQMALFPADRPAPELEHESVQVKLNELELKRPRQWGTCYLVLRLWEQLKLDTFWSGRLVPSRQGTRWLNIFKTLVCYQLIDPGSEWRLHRQWFEQSAVGDLLGEDELWYKKTSSTVVWTSCSNTSGISFLISRFDGKACLMRALRCCSMT